MSDDKAKTDTGTPEDYARRTIDNLLGGRIAPKTVRDIGDAVNRAKSDSAVSHSIRRGLTWG